MATRQRKPKIAVVETVQSTDNNVVDNNIELQANSGETEMNTEIETQTVVEPTEVGETEVTNTTDSLDETDDSVKTETGEQAETDEATEEATDEITEETTDDAANEIDYQGEVEKLIADLGYEHIYHKLTAKAGTKMEQAVAIYTQMYLNDNKRRCDVIREFMSKLDMSQDGASTYFQNIKKKIGGRD